MDRPRIVPWASAAEFLQVGEQIYSSSGDKTTDLKNRRKGLGTIKMWSCRAKLPTTIQVTAQLLETWLHDHEHQTDSLMELRLMYSMSLIRFVNLLVDVEQKGYFASSIMILAERLGIPVWLVELRHAATHEKLPGIEMLRLANKQALQYLYDNYWALQQQNSFTINPTADPQSPGITKESIIQLLSEFKKQRCLYLGGLSSGNKPKVDFKNYVVVAQEIGKSMHKDAMVSLLIPLLLDSETGFMVPSQQNHNSAKLKTKQGRFEKKSKKLKEPKLGDRLDETSKEVEREKDDLLKIYSPLFDCWFHTWGKNAFIEEMTSSILMRLKGAGTRKFTSFDSSVRSVKCRSEEVYAGMLAEWLIFLIEMHYKTRESSSVKHRRKQVYSFINRDQIVGSCLHNPSKYSINILKALTRADRSFDYIAPLVNYQETFVDIDGLSHSSSNSSTVSQNQISHYSGSDLQELLEKIEDSEDLLKNRLSKAKGSLVTDLAIPDSTDTVLGLGHVQSIEFVNAYNQYNRETELRFVDSKGWKPSPIGCLPNNLLSRLG